MADREPKTELDKRFSDDAAVATEWSTARDLLDRAELFWLSTVRPDGRPHVTPLIAVLLGNAVYFCTGPTERKAANLEHNRHCVLTTGCNALGEGLDLVIEGDAVPVHDEAALTRLAAAYEAKYGKDWHFDVADGNFQHEAGMALVFEVTPATAFGFAKGVYGQTTWRFS